MRILLFSNWLPPIQAGSSYYSSSLAQSLVARGHEVAVVTLDWGFEHQPPPDLPFTVYKLPVWRLPKLPLFYNLKLVGLAFTPGNDQRLKALIQRFRPHLLHHVNHIFDTVFLSANAARWAGIPIVGSITTPIQHQNRWKQQIMTWADRLTVGQFGVKRWDSIVSLDHTVHDYVGKLYGKATQLRSQVIPFGVRLESKTLYETPIQESAQRPQILMVGHIHPFRNPVQLIRAMPFVLKTIPDACLVLAGRMDLKGPVKVAKELGLTSEQVRFLGETPHRETVHLMKISHIFASWATGPYRSLGTAPMEAMLCGIPVMNDLPQNLFGEGKLQNGENIVLVDSRDPQAIAQAIIRLLKDDELRHRIGAEGRRFVLEHLNWENIAQQMESLYERLLAERGEKGTSEKVPHREELKLCR
jgi:glycosyltransferase involved in cell wall biosynthesis